MAPPGSSRPSLTYTDQTLEASLPAITPCLNFRFQSRSPIYGRCAPQELPLGSRSEGVMIEAVILAEVIAL